MRISIAGDHEAAAPITERLAADGHQVASVDVHGATSATRVTEALDGSDAVVLAGEAPAALVIDAVQLAGIVHLVLVSPGAGAEAAARASALTWTAVRTGDEENVPESVAAAIAGQLPRP